jgi:hypothetical protein
VHPGRTATFSIKAPAAKKVELSGQFIKGCSSPQIDGLLVLHEVVQADAPMGTDHAEGDLALLQPLHQERPRHIQQISGLLGGELSGEWL